MCGRYTIVTPVSELEARFIARFEGSLEPNYNAAPTQMLPIITVDDPYRLKLARWGLVPAWAKDISIGSKMTNARAETLEEKPSFRNLIFSHRCLVPADGFYEWKGEAGAKQPYRITREDGKLMAFAGLYDIWKNNGQDLLTYAIITTEAHGPMRDIHERMPLILNGHQEHLWMEAGDEDYMIRDIIRTPPRVSLAFTPVSKAVNNARNNEPSLFSPDACGSK